MLDIDNNVAKVLAGLAHAGGVSLTETVRANICAFLIGMHDWQKENPKGTTNEYVSYLNIRMKTADGVGAEVMQRLINGNLVSNSQ